MINEQPSTPKLKFLKTHPILGSMFWGLLFGTLAGGVLSLLSWLSFGTIPFLVTGLLLFGIKLPALTVAVVLLTVGTGLLGSLIGLFTGLFIYSKIEGMNTRGIQHALGIKEENQALLFKKNKELSSNKTPQDLTFFKPDKKEPSLQQEDDLEESEVKRFKK